MVTEGPGHRDINRKDVLGRGKSCRKGPVSTNTLTGLEPKEGPPEAGVQRAGGAWFHGMRQRKGQVGKSCRNLQGTATSFEVGFYPRSNEYETTKWPDLSWVTEIYLKGGQKWKQGYPLGTWCYGPGVGVESNKLIQGMF